MARRFDGATVLNAAGRGDRRGSRCRVKGGIRFASGFREADMNKGLVGWRRAVGMGVAAVAVSDGLACSGGPLN